MAKPAPDINKMNEKLEYLLDRLAIIDCIYRYSRGLDRHDEDILASVFHHDAVDNHGSFVGYIPEFIKWGNAGHDAAYQAHTHNITCHSADIQGDVAHTESYVIFCLRHNDARSVRVGGGRYIDRLEKRDGEWKISLRRLIMDWRFEADGTSFMANAMGYELGRQNRTDVSYERPMKLPPVEAEKIRLKGKPPAKPAPKKK